MPVRTKRWNDEASADDGYRLLICRYRPRGVSKANERWDGWCPELGPSRELHAAFYGKRGRPLEFDEYARRFRREMETRRYWIQGFAERVRAGETITLLCSSACTDPSRCHRTIVQQLLEEMAFPAEPGRAVVRRTR